MKAPKSPKAAPKVARQEIRELALSVLDPLLSHPHHIWGAERGWRWSHPPVASGLVSQA